jgi:hypothetical protein
VNRAGENALRHLDHLEAVMASMPLDPPMQGNLADLQQPNLESLREAITTYDQHHERGARG